MSGGRRSIQKLLWLIVCLKGTEKRKIIAVHWHRDDCGRLWRVALSRTRAARIGSRAALPLCTPLDAYPSCISLAQGGSSSAKLAVPPQTIGRSARDATGNLLSSNRGAESAPPVRHELVPDCKLFDGGVLRASNCALDSRRAATVLRLSRRWNASTASARAPSSSSQTLHEATRRVATQRAPVDRRAFSWAFRVSTSRK